jgi:hypothetical protein
MKVSNFYKGKDAYEKTDDGEIEALIDQVLDQISKDFYDGELVPLDAMLRQLDPSILRGYLSEDAA